MRPIMNAQKKKFRKKTILSRSMSRLFTSATANQSQTCNACDAAGNVIQTHEDEGDFKESWHQIPELIEHARLLERDFAHELCAKDLANIEAFHLYRLLLIGCAHDFSGDRIEFFARVILRGHVLRFHHYQDVEVLRCSVVAEQDLVIDD